MKKGLIMEGGAMRGMFTCGVLDVFLENGIEFDGAAGISAGAVFGCNFKSKQIGRALRYNKEYCADPRYCSFRSLMKTGDLFGVKFCYHEIPDKLDVFDRDTFSANPMEFFVGATDIKTGKAIYHKCTDGRGDDIRWMQASASMPLVSRPVKIGERILLDGGIVDPVPYRYMENAGYDRNVMILTQPKGYVKKIDPTLPLIRARFRDFPAVTYAMTVRHVRYNLQMKDIAEREALGAAIVIRPPEPLGINRTVKDPSELERVYRIGRKEAEKNLSAVVRFLSRGDAEK